MDGEDMMEKMERKGKEDVGGVEELEEEVEN